MLITFAIHENHIWRIRHFLNFVTLAHGKNDFAERSKILLDTDLKIILLENNERCCKKFLNSSNWFERFI